MYLVVIPLCNKSSSSLRINTSIRIHFATAGGGKHSRQDPQRHVVPLIDIHPGSRRAASPLPPFTSPMYKQLTPRFSRRRRVAKWVKAPVWLKGLISVGGTRTLTLVHLLCQRSAKIFNSFAALVMNTSSDLLFT